MAQCHGYFPLTYPHFLLLAAFWSQGCIRSSTWEGVVHTEFSAVLSQRHRFKGRSGFIPVQRRQQGCPRDGTGILVSGTAGSESSNIQGQVLLRHSACKGEKAGDTAVCRGWGGALQIMPHSTFAWLAMFLALLFKKYFSEERRNSRKLQIQPCM